jgi:hypothetical protein
MAIINNLMKDGKKSRSARLKTDDERVHQVVASAKNC